MALVSMPYADTAPQRKRMYFDKPCAKPSLAPAAASGLMARQAQHEAVADRPSAMLMKTSAGVRVVRGNAVLHVQAGCLLQLGDRVIVPAEGCAQAVFQEHGGQMLLGTFEGGTDASLTYFSRKDGACSVVFDLVRGHVDISLSAMGTTRLAEAGAGRPGRTAIGFHCYSQPIASR